MLLSDKVRKHTIKDIEKLYDRLYDIGNFLLNKYKPCKIKGSTCVGKFDTEFCCSGCVYVTPKGCSTKVLWCKLWLCFSVQCTNKKLASQFSMLTHIACINKLIAEERLPKEYTIDRIKRYNEKGIV